MDYKGFVIRFVYNHYTVSHPKLEGLTICNTDTVEEAKEEIDTLLKHIYEDPFVYCVNWTNII